MLSSTKIIFFRISFQHSDREIDFPGLAPLTLSPSRHSKSKQDRTFCDVLWKKRFTSFTAIENTEWEYPAITLSLVLLDLILYISEEKKALHII